jgi:hypothetical protein
MTSKKYELNQYLVVVNFLTKELKQVELSLLLPVLEKIEYKNFLTKMDRITYLITVELTDQDAPLEYGQIT